MTDQRFTELLSKKLSNEISAEDDQEFLSMLRENEDYRLEYESLNGYFQNDDEPYEHAGVLFEKIKERISHPGTADTAVIPLVPAKRSLRLWYRVAAVLAFCICTFTAYRVFLPKDNTGQQSLAGTRKKLTSNGRQKSAVTLSDGTRVTLNAESQLWYPSSFKGVNREVYLTGEGFFDVAKDHQHPFIVHTQKMDIRVLGTAFDVKSYQNEQSTEATLLRGRIQITLNSSPKTPIFLNPSEKFTLTHSAGSSAEKPAAPVYSISSLTYLNPDNKNVIIETSWMDNKLAFKNERFDKISLLIERWYGVNFVFRSDEIRNYKFTGQFEKESLPEALKALQFIAAFRYEIKGKTIYLYR
jgi:transmembrane sensor